MPQIVRPAVADDILRLVDLLLLDAEERRAQDAILWAMEEDAPAQIEKALAAALDAERPPLRQIWQVAEDGGAVTGAIHSTALSVPPIYAGASGEPGLILPDSVAAPGAPPGTVDALVDAAEDALRKAGARLLLASFVTGEDWRDAFRSRGYEPLTLYLSRSGLDDARTPTAIRPAAEADVPGIVARSAENRRILFEIDPFWEIHPDADARFSAWMTRSLALPDRDMMVAGPPDDLDGYVIAQPASRIHFPAAHDVAGTGVIDDFHHRDLADPATLPHGCAGATALLRAAEAEFAQRGVGAAFVVCPAGWRSKMETLQAAGYGTAMTWSIKR